MEEKIRHWIPKGTLKIKYTNDKGNVDYWIIDSKKLFYHIISVVRHYYDIDIKLTNRQLYYQLVGKDLIPNALEIYKRICKFLTDCRYGGFIDWSAIEDRDRIPKRHPQWKDILDLVDSAINQYRMHRWDNQKYHVELYCEKAAMESTLRPISDKYHIYFGYNKGYCSASTIYEIAQRVKERLASGKMVILLYLGDHDSSGLDMVRDVHDRIFEFLTETWEKPLPKKYVKLGFHVKHVALTYEQIKKYNPPPNPAKLADPRAKDYIAKYGKVSWELDSIDPEVLRDITENAILEYLDIDKYNAIVNKEENGKIPLKEFAKKLKEKLDKEK